MAVKFFDHNAFDPSEWCKPLTANEVFERISTHTPQSRLPLILVNKGVITGEEFLDSLIGEKWKYYIE